MLSLLVWTEDGNQFLCLMGRCIIFWGGARKHCRKVQVLMCAKDTRMKSFYGDLGNGPFSSSSPVIFSLTIFTKRLTCQLFSKSSQLQSRHQQITTSVSGHARVQEESRIHVEFLRSDKKSNVVSYDREKKKTFVADIFHSSKKSQACAGRERGPCLGLYCGYDIFASQLVKIQKQQLKSKHSHLALSLVMQKWQMTLCMWQGKGLEDHFHLKKGNTFLPTLSSLLSHSIFHALWT